ncbi:hypothetical protein NQZ68_020423 [Dissostichus eleginoides]|nr:hypothetical protein NQZ68_020423 [Dissostichus eleginoides]
MMRGCKEQAETHVFIMCTSCDRALPLFVRPHSFWAAFLCRVGCVSSLQVDTGANQPSCRIYLTNFRMTDCIWNQQQW